MLSERRDRVQPGQEIATVTADGAFDPRKCHDAIGARGATAIIPPRKSAKPRKPDPPGAVARTEFLRTSTEVGRTIWRRWGGYRGNAGARYEEDEKTIRGIVFSDAGMHGFKLLGQRFSAHLFDRQLAETGGRVAVLTGFTALGPPITEVVRYVRSGKGQARSTAGFHRGRWHDFEERGHGLFAMRVLARRATRDVFAATASAICLRPSPAAIRSTAWTEMPRAISADCHSGAGSQPQTRSAFSGPAPSGRHHLFQQMVTGFRHSFIETRGFCTAYIEPGAAAIRITARPCCGLTRSFRDGG